MKVALYNYICGAELYRLGQERLGRTISNFGCDKFLISEKDRPHWPNHNEVNYIFKSLCLKEAMIKDYDWFIWSDSRMMFSKNWQYIKDNILKPDSDIVVPFNGFKDCFWSVGQWTSDYVLDRFGVSREEAFDIPTVVSGFFAINLKSEIGREIAHEFIEISANPQCSNGPRYVGGAVSIQNRAYLGHRHDQSILSLLVHKHNVKPKLGIYADPANSVGLPKTLTLTKDTVVVWQHV